MRPIYSTILFDFDGTLTSSFSCWLEAFHYAFSQFGIKLSDEDVIKKCFYRSFEEVVAQFNLPSIIPFGQLITDGLVVTDW